MAIDATRWQRMEDLYHRALELPATDRVAFLERTTAGDSELRREVQSLLDETEHTLTLNTRREGTPAETTAAWGPFRLTEKIGQGAFGEVYRARDTKLDRDVALKLLYPQDESDYERMLKEARSHASVRHPNIVPIYGADRFEGRVGFWSEFVHGKTLSALLAAQGAFGPRETSLIGIELCRSLSAVHAAGLLHRDIKTSNVMREEGGRILLMDFGLSHDATRVGLFGGTPGYMAPELFAGHSASVSTDIYALGVLLYRLVTVQYPDENGRRVNLIERRPDLPPDFVRVIEKAIAPDPALRYKSVGEMMAALNAEQPKPRLKAVAAPAIAVAALAALGWWALTRQSAPTGEVYKQYQTAEDLSIRYDNPDNLEKAVGLYNAVIAKDPKFALAHAGLCRAWFLRARSMKDLTLLDKAFPECVKAKELSPQLASVFTTLSLAHTLQGKTDLAMQDLQPALDLDARSAEVQAALCALRDKQGRDTDAEQACKKAIALKPDDWRWHNQLALLYNRRGDFKRAVDQLELVVRQTPNNATGLLNLGALYIQEERFDEARSALQKSIALRPTFSAYLTLGNIEESQGRYKQAADAAAQATALNPGYFIGWGNLAAAYSLAGDREKSLSAYKRAISLAETARAQDEENPRTVVELGGYYAALGQSAQSLPLLEQAVALAPTDAEVVLKAGEAFEILGRRDRAVDLVNTAIRLGYPQSVVRRDPALAKLCRDPKFLLAN